MPLSEPDIIFFRYTFIMGQAESLVFEVRLDPEDLSYQTQTLEEPAPWTALDFHTCDGCPLLASGIERCPVAVNLQDIIHGFKRAISYEKVDIVIETPERTYSKLQGSMQSGLSSILGLIMTTSGCPSLDYLRPMTKTHLPFASMSETIYRAISMYLMGQFTRAKNGLEPDWSLAGLTTIYNRIDRINMSMVKRLQSATEQDASLNAVVILDSFAKMVPMTIGGLVNDLDVLFWPYLRDDQGDVPKL